MTISIEQLRDLAASKLTEDSEVIDRAIDVIEALQAQVREQSDEVFSAQVVAQGWKNRYEGQERECGTLKDERDTWKCKAKLWAMALNRATLRIGQLEKQVAQQQQTVWDSMQPQSRIPVRNPQDVALLDQASDREHELLEEIDALKQAAVNKGWEMLNLKDLVSYHAGRHAEIVQELENSPDYLREHQRAERLYKRCRRMEDAVVACFNTVSENAAGKHDEF